MKKQLLMVQDADDLILGVMWHDDADVGPVPTQAAAIPGTRLV